MALIGVGNLLSPRLMQWERPVRVKRKHVEDIEAVATREWAHRWTSTRSGLRADKV